MPKKQWTLQGNYKPWYVGWRICHQKASEVLQKFYDTPSFIPKDWKLNKTEWIFMGTPGVGAPFHLDNVQGSSWQAQVPLQCTTVYQVDFHKFVNLPISNFNGPWVLFWMSLSASMLI